MKNFFKKGKESPKEQEEIPVRADEGTGPWDAYGYPRETDANEIEKMIRAATFRTSGLIVSRPPNMIEESENVYPVPRNDGKQVCRKLREAREALARANHIPFISVPCRQEEACGGTCPTCDAEAEYLERELAKLPEHMRVYPKLEFGDEDE